MKKTISLLIITALTITGCSETENPHETGSSQTTHEAQHTEVTPTDKREKNDLDIIQIASGVNSFTYLSSDGVVYASGNNKFGELGVGDFDEHEGIVEVLIPEPIKMIGYCVAVTYDYDLYVWGAQYIEDEKIKSTLIQPENYHSYPFVYVSSPIKLEFGKPVTKILSTWEFTNILTEDGKVYTFGADPDEDFMGYPTMGIHYPSQNPQPVNFPEKIIDIACGVSHALALGESGTLYGYGSSRYGQFGLDTENVKDYIIVTDEHEVSVFSATGQTTFYAYKNDPTVLHILGYLIYDEDGTPFPEKAYAEISFPSEIVELLSPDVGSILIARCKDGEMYGLGGFYHNVFNLSGNIKEPKLLEADVEISSIVRYTDTLFYTDESNNLMHSE
jgi:alpha-tubulin suppressor-like RCC1 family protein